MLGDPRRHLVRSAGVDHAAFELTQLVGDCRQPVEKLCVDYQGARARVIDDAAEERSAVGEIDRYLHRAATRETAEQGRQVDAIGHHEQHPILVLDSEGDQTVGDSICPRVHLSIGDFPALDIDDQGFVTHTFRSMSEDATNRAVFERIFFRQVRHPICSLHHVLDAQCELHRKFCLDR